MLLARVDQAELLAALYDLGDAPPFATFLERLRRRTGASATFVTEQDERGDWRVHGSGAPDLAALRSLRPGRLYDFDALGVAGQGKVIRANDTGRTLCLGIAGGGDADFTAADGALLVALAPHVAIASDNLARLAAARFDLAAATAALERAGVGWTRLDPQGEPRSDLSAKHRTALAEQLASGASVALAGATLALPFPAGGVEAALALFRTEATAIDRAAVFAEAFGLTRAEARVAVILAEGTSIAEAAGRLGITEQTARYYSKRLYAATGARGQADLVRLFWTSVAALA